MKKLATLVLAAGLMLGAAAPAKAVDIKMSGAFDFTFQWNNENVTDGVSGGYNGSGSSSAFYQRIRTQIDIIASETLRGVIMLETGDTTWGKSSAAAGRGAGGGIGADGISLEVKRAYLDWMVPSTDLKIRVGIQGFATPAFAGGSSIFNDEVAGITTSYKFNDTVALTAWWLRPYDDNNSDTGAHNEMDMFGLALPLTFDGVKVTPWGMYSSIGRDIRGSYSGPTNFINHTSAMLPRWIGAAALPSVSDDRASAWWAGVGFDVTYWNPFRFAMDFVYGDVDFGNYGTMDADRAGWLLTFLAEYKMDFGTPGLFMWYGSGDDSDANDGSEMLPAIKASNNFTSFGQDGAGFNTAGTALETSLSGTWGIGLQIKDMSFVEGLKHVVRVAYYNGTNDDSMASVMGTPTRNGAVSGGSAFTYMTEDDSAWEFNFDSSYKIYENLTLGLELGYIIADFDNNRWVNWSDQDMYKIGIGLQYSF